MASFGVAPRELLWIRDKVKQGYSLARMSREYEQAFKKSRTASSISRVIADYGLNGQPGRDKDARMRVTVMRELIRDRMVIVRARASQMVSPVVRGRFIKSARWLVRHEMAHLPGMQPGEGLFSSQYRLPDAIYLVKEYIE